MLMVVRSFQTCLELSIFIILAQVSFSSLSGVSEVSLRTVLGLSHSSFLQVSLPQNS